MLSSCFLGANTKDGFVSLYGGFPPDGDAMLHIIKGGPGTGKSGFMRALARAAETKGLEVQTVLCSGDPDSLDGVYIPALKQAWADGTAPHVLDAGVFGVDSDYVNLGAFCRTALDDGDRAAAVSLSRSYKREYAAAYSYLSAAESLRAGSLPEAPGEEERAALRMRVAAVFDGCSGSGRREDRVERVFLSAVTCKGVVRLAESVKKLCRHIIRADGKLGGDEALLSLALEEAKRRALRVILCPSPLDPSRPDAVLVPGLSLAFLSSGWSGEPFLSISTDSVFDPERRAVLAEAISVPGKLRERCLALAVERLASAKALHDELEHITGKTVDFPALTQYTEEYTEKLFR